MSNESALQPQLLILSLSRPISEKTDPSNHGLMGRPAPVCKNQVYMGFHLLSGLCTSHRHGTQGLPTPNSPVLSCFNHCSLFLPSFPFQEGRFGVQNDGDLKGNFPASKILPECGSADHPRSACFVSLVNPSPSLLLASLR